MKSKLLLLTILLSVPNLFSQTKFEAGYIILTNGTKTNCLIKNEDWKGSPATFEYKIGENDEVKLGNVSTVKEFGSSENFKYLTVTLPVEQSSDKVGDLTEDRNPIFKDETLFLKVLVEGNASLYYTTKNGENRFFYKVNDSKIEQLIYKRYTTLNQDIAKNNRYKQQLITDIQCSSIDAKALENIEYKKSSLTTLFKKYNTCQNGENIVYAKKDVKSGFNLSIRPGVTFGSLSILKAGEEKLKFDNQTGIRIGLEAEYVFPFNNGKWSIFIEPAYRNYKAEKEVIYVDFLTFQKTTLVTAEYNSIELPIGARHYMFLNQDSAFFLDAAFVIDASILDSKIESSNENSYDMDVKTDVAIGFGLGFKYKKRYSLEARYHTSRKITNYLDISTDYNSFALIAGYNFL
ncbi:MAG: hypothetical protein V7655_11370 [Aequorivita antarctica]